MNKKIIILTAVSLAIIMLIGSVLILLPKEENTDTGSTTLTTEKTQVSTAETEDTHTETTGYVPDLNDGNEAYLDLDIVEQLTVMEAAGAEDEVNEVLDTLILLINHFAEQEYSIQAVRQIQRFYFEYRDTLSPIEFENLCEKITECFSAAGAVQSGFSGKVQSAFGWGASLDFTYIFEAEAGA